MRVLLWYVIAGLGLLLYVVVWLRSRFPRTLFILFKGEAKVVELDLFVDAAHSELRQRGEPRPDSQQLWDELIRLRESLPRGTGLMRLRPTFSEVVDAYLEKERFLKKLGPPEQKKGFPHF